MSFLNFLELRQKLTSKQIRNLELHTYIFLHSHLTFEKNGNSTLSTLKNWNFSAVNFKYFFFKYISFNITYINWFRKKLGFQIMESKCTGIISNNKEYKYKIVFWFCCGGIWSCRFFSSKISWNWFSIWFHEFFRQKFYLSSLPALSLAILTRDSFEAPYNEEI